MCLVGICLILGGILLILVMPKYINLDQVKPKLTKEELGRIERGKKLEILRAHLDTLAHGFVQERIKAISKLVEIANRMKRRMVTKIIQPALIEALKDTNRKVREASEDALILIGAGSVLKAYKKQEVIEAKTLKKKIYKKRIIRRMER